MDHAHVYGVGRSQHFLLVAIDKRQEVCPGKSAAPPGALSQGIVRLIEKLAKERNAKSLRMVSGAVHDSPVMAELTDVGMNFLPSQGGRSHCLEEFTDFKDIQLGTEILLGGITELSA